MNCNITISLRNLERLERFGSGANDATNGLSSLAMIQKINETHPREKFYDEQTK